jgi:hypothetical protein
VAIFTLFWRSLSFLINQGLGLDGQVSGKLLSRKLGSRIARLAWKKRVFALCST